VSPWGPPKKAVSPQLYRQGFILYKLKLPCSVLTIKSIYQFPRILHQEYPSAAGHHVRLHYQQNLLPTNQLPCRRFLLHHHRQNFQQLSQHQLHPKSQLLLLPRNRHRRLPQNRRHRPRSNQPSNNISYFQTFVISN
jgi:hypothetical protein